MSVKYWRVMFVQKGCLPAAADYGEEGDERTEKKGILRRSMSKWRRRKERWEGRKEG